MYNNEKDIYKAVNRLYNIRKKAGAVSSI